MLCIKSHESNMNISLSNIEKEAEKIICKIQEGKLIDGCCMSAVQTPTMEAWEIAQQLAESGTLPSQCKQELFSKLDKDVQSQLEATKYDDFDLIYERLLQLINQR